MTTLTLTDGRVAMVRPFDPARARWLRRFLEEAGIPRTLRTAPVHACLIGLSSIESIDGQPLVWPEPTLAAIETFVRGFDDRDVRALNKRVLQTESRGSRLTGRITDG